MQPRFVGPVSELPGTTDEHSSRYLRRLPETDVQVVDVSIVSMNTLQLSVRRKDQSEALSGDFTDDIDEILGSPAIVQCVPDRDTPGVFDVICPDNLYVEIEAAAM